MNPREKQIRANSVSRQTMLNWKKKHSHLLIILIFWCCSREEIQALFILKCWKANEKRGFIPFISLDGISESFRKNFLLVINFFHFTMLCWNVISYINSSGKRAKMMNHVVPIFAVSQHCDLSSILSTWKIVVTHQSFYQMNLNDLLRFNTT